MDFALAKLKRARKKPFRKLLSDVALFKNVDPQAIHLVQFNPDHKLDEDSWFVVDSFSKSDFFLDLLAGELDAKNFDNFEKSRFADINCILSVQGDDAYFQKVTPSSFIKKKLIKFGEIAEIEEGQSRIVVREAPDAVFFKGEDKLIFREIAAISSVFKGIDQLYKEATHENVVEFLKQDFLELSAGFNANSVSKPNRKRLALVIDTMTKMADGQKDDLVAYIREYCGDKVDVSVDKKRLLLSTDIQLKFILYGLEERYYTTQHGKEKRLANSVETL